MMCIDCWFLVFLTVFENCHRYKYKYIYIYQHISYIKKWSDISYIICIDCDHLLTLFQIQCRGTSGGSRRFAGIAGLSWWVAHLDPTNSWNMGAINLLYMNWTQIYRATRDFEIVGEDNTRVYIGHEPLADVIQRLHTWICGTITRNRWPRLLPIKWPAIVLGWRQ